MATYYYRSAATLFDDAASWSLSSGGGADGAVPVSGDTAIFDGSSNNTCSLSQAHFVDTLDTSLWTGNIALGTFTITVEQTCVLSANTTFTQSGLGELRIGVSGSTTTTFTGNGCATIPRIQLIGTTDIITIVDQIDATIGIIGNANPAVQLNGGHFNIYGSASLNGTATGGTTQINLLTGVSGGNFSTAGARPLSNNTVIKPTGTLTLTGTRIDLANCKLSVDLSDGGTISQGSTRIEVGANMVFDTNEVKWNEVRIIANSTTQLDSVFKASNLSFAGLSIASHSFTGGFGIDVDELVWINPNTASRTLSLEEGVLNNINNTFTLNGVAGSITLKSTSATVKSRLTMPASCVKSLTGTITVEDIDSSEGDTVFVDPTVTLNDTINWDFKPSSNFFIFF